MRSQSIRRLFVLFFLVWAGFAFGQTAEAPQEQQEEQQEKQEQPEPDGPHLVELTVDGAIGPATTDYLTRSIEKAHQAGAVAVLIRMDTPGGLDSSTRDIIQAILAAPIPVITYVHPAGARAASAGTYILYGSHVAAMTPSTSLGAATPVQMGGGSPPGGEDQNDGQNGGGNGEETGEDSGEGANQGTSEGNGEEAGDKGSAPQPSSAMERKAINDSVAFIRGLAERHGRNADWAERAVREAISATATEALKLNVVDVVAPNREDLLKQIDGREVAMSGGPEVLNTEGLPIVDYEPDWRSEFLGLITNPQLASILMLIGIYGLILEGYNPGAMVPGVTGAICLLIALYALQVLPVNYAGLALILLGAVLIISELFMPSFGVLGIGGVVALVLGSIFLVDTDAPGMEVSYELVGAIAAVGGVAVLFIATMMGRSLRIPRQRANEAMVGKNGEVAQRTKDGYKVGIEGEFWDARSEETLTPGESVTVVDQEGLILMVRRI